MQKKISCDKIEHISKAYETTNSSNRHNPQACVCSTTSSCTDATNHNSNSLQRNSADINEVPQVSNANDAQYNNNSSRKLQFSEIDTNDTVSNVFVENPCTDSPKENKLLCSESNGSFINGPNKNNIDDNEHYRESTEFRNESFSTAFSRQQKHISRMKVGTMDMDLLKWKDMPDYLQFNPYIIDGYRPIQNIRGCLLSMFYWHNETINILTHAIPILYILAIVPCELPWESGFRFLSFCHLIGSVAPWCGSFLYHLFMNVDKGEKVYYCLLKLDMLGIWISQSFGAMPLVTATTLCFSNPLKWIIIIIYCLLCFWGLYKAMNASSPWQRRLCFALPFAFRSFLTFLRAQGMISANHGVPSHVYLQDGVSIIGGAIGAMRIPEKWFPGLLDYYFNSHNIMHILVVVAVYSMHQATIKELEWISNANCDNNTNTTNSILQEIILENIEL